MIPLDNSLFVGRGLTRTCFRHPDHSDLCIKVEHADLAYSRATKEAKYYEKLARIRPNYDYQSITRFHGWTETSLGRGQIFEFVRDQPSGGPSATIAAITQSDFAGIKIEALFIAIESFFDDLIRNMIVIRDMHPENVCVQKLSSGKYRCVAVDGVGHRDAIPIVDHWRWFARKKITRHFNRSTIPQILSVPVVPLSPATSICCQP